MDPRNRRQSIAVGVWLAAGVTLAACAAASTPAEPDPEAGTGTITSSLSPSTTSMAAPITPTAVAVEVVASYPHDPQAYTQGLEVTADGLLIESTGLVGRSTLRLVEPTTGEVVRSVPLDDDLFGEGATVVDDEVWQLTWQNGAALVHGLDDLVERRRVAYEGEGWGLCATADRLVMSDGTSRLTFRDPETFGTIGSIDVTADGQPVARLNELECVGDLVWANVYQTTRLLAIDPVDGRVVGEADLAPLVPPGFENDTDSVANGIAHDPATGRFWLTGKNWPVLYDVELVPAEPLAS